MSPWAENCPRREGLVASERRVCNNEYSREQEAAPDNEGYERGITMANEAVLGDLISLW